MLKKIDVDALCIGMYVHDLSVPWYTHAFMRPRFCIDSAETLAAVRACTRSVVIDTERGVDVASITPAAVETPATPTAAPTRVSLDEELQVARKLLREARDSVRQTMADARTGSISTIPHMREMAQQMMESASRQPGALLSLAGLKTKDDYTFSHCVAVGAFMIALGRQLGLTDDELREAGTAGLLHDVGKSRIPDEVLNKPGRLTDAEFDIVRTHPTLGYRMLRDAGYEDSQALEVVLHHHERLDGKGYPDALDAARITRLARMGAVADVYDAVTSDRCYHRAMPPTAALQMMLSDSDHFDGEIVRAFVKTVGIYPNRSLVRLKSGRLAVVIEQHASNASTPIVKVFFSVRSNAPTLPVMLNLAHGTDAIVSAEDPVAWRLDVKLLAGLED